MAISATINKVTLNIADMDRHYYQTHELVVAQHPSETDFRFMMRLIAFVLNADEQLSFTKGLSADDEPDIWQKSLSDEIELWIDFGQPDEKRIRKACGRAREVFIYTYAQRSAKGWWQQISSKLERFDNLHVISLPEKTGTDLAQLVQRKMTLQCSIQDNEVWFGDETNSVHVVPAVKK